MKRFNKTVGYAVLAFGFVLVVVSALVLLNSSIQHKKIKEAFPKAITMLEEITPNRRPGVPNDRSDASMPVFEIFGEDYVGILEVESQKAKFPVLASYSSWDSSKRPAVFWGSAYDSSMVIAVNYKEQFDFAGELDNDDIITFTDVMGQVFRYRIDKINHSDKATQDKLITEDDDLTVFLKKDSQYLIIRCKADI